MNFFLSFRVTIKTGADTLVDSGDIYDTTYAGGRLGVFVFGQENVIWSKMKYQCASRLVRIHTYM